MNSKRGVGDVCENENNPDEVFKEHPSLEGVLVGYYGTIVEASTMEEVEQRLGMYGNYMVAYIAGADRLVHRLVAETFIEEREPMADEVDFKFQVNHKDGNKLNNRANNLEWVTGSENRIHAVKTGLASSIPVLVKDLRTDEITEYYGINECGRAFGINPSLVHSYLKNPDRIRKLFYVFIRKGDEWPNLTKDNITPRAYGVPNVLLGKNIETDEVLIFGSIRKAAELLMIKQDTLYMHIKRYGEKPYHGFSFKYSDDVELNSEYLKQHKGKAPNHSIRRKQYPLLVFDTLTGNETRYETANEFVKVVGSNRNTIRCAISRNNGKWKHYHIRYAELKQSA